MNVVAVRLVRIGQVPLEPCRQHPLGSRSSRIPIAQESSTSRQCEWNRATIEFECDGSGVLAIACFQRLTNMPGTPKESGSGVSTAFERARIHDVVCFRLMGKDGVRRHTLRLCTSPTIQGCASANKDNSCRQSAMVIDP